MLKFGECYAIFIENDLGELTCLNSFFPENMEYSDRKVNKLLEKARNQLTQWYGTYYSDMSRKLILSIGEREGDEVIFVRKV